MCVCFFYIYIKEICTRLNINLQNQLYMHQNVYTSDVRKSSTCYHFFEPQDIFSLGSGPLLCRTVTWSGTCLGHQSQVPNLGFCHLISSPCCSLSTYCLCYSCYRFSVLKRFRHCLPHTHFTAQPPTCSIQHYRSLPSLLQFAVWMRSWHSQRHTIHSSLSSTTASHCHCYSLPFGSTPGTV